MKTKEEKRKYSRDNYARKKREREEAITARRKAEAEARQPSVEFLLSLCDFQVTNLAGILYCKPDRGSVIAELVNLSSILKDCSHE